MRRGFAEGLYGVNISVYVVAPMKSVQVRMPDETVEQIDRWVSEGKFKSRSEAVKMIVSAYQERERTREFYKMLVERSKEAKEKPQDLIPLEEVG